MSYNGYTSYQTWAVALWIDNNRDSYDERNTLVSETWEDAVDDSVFTRSQNARYDLADTLKAWVQEAMIPDLGATLASDLLTAALSEVNWLELADTWLADAEADYERMDK